MEQYQTSNPQLLQRVQSGQIQRSFIDFRVEGGKIHVSENVQFKREMEQNIIQHFNFMLRVSFYSGVFNEIATFIMVYQKQFQQSTQLFEMWQAVDETIVQVSYKISEAQGRLQQIENYNQSGVMMQEFNELKKSLSLTFLDEEYAKQSALKNQMDERDRAALEANAKTSLQEGTIYLQWLLLQKQRQIKFEQDLNVITTQWNEDYQIFNAGQQFIQSINLNQVAIYNENDWNQGTWTKQLKNQVDIANPFFSNMYKKYLVCYKFHQDLEELEKLVKIRQEIKNVKIEIAVREAEKPFLEAFLAYWQKQLKAAKKDLMLLQSNDKIDRLQECHANLNKQVQSVERAFNDLGIDTTKKTTTMTYVSAIGHDSVTHATQEITYVYGVKIRKDNVYLNYENPFDVKYSQETLEQMEVVKRIQKQIDILKEELKKLQKAYNRLQQLNEEPEKFNYNMPISFNKNNKRRQINITILIIIIVMLNGKL